MFDGLGGVKFLEGFEVADLGLEHGGEHECSFSADGEAWATAG
jgi:hypothetical protein